MVRKPAETKSIQGKSLDVLHNDLALTPEASAMLVNCDKPLGEFTVPVTLMHHHLNLKRCRCRQTEKEERFK